MRVLLPWSTSYYITLNAFHPLYSAFSQSDNAELRYIIPCRDFGWDLYRLLRERGVYLPNFLQELWWLRPLTKKQRKKFYSFYCLREINYIDKLPREIEFLHTAPITSGNHDFVIHCESFLPFFMPFFSEDLLIDCDDVDLIKIAYGDLLRSKCKAIVSHSKKTLNELSKFFSCPEIDKLLHHMDIGVTRKINFIKSSKEDKVLKFLFHGSAHNNPNNFYSRGGVVSIKLALELLLKVQKDQKINKELRFIFRAKRPDDNFLKQANINIMQLHREESMGNIVWIENRLTQFEMDKLVATSDFLLMLAASLHSDAIIGAMRYKTIPIVLDSPDYAIYVDKNSSITINGIYKEIVDELKISELIKNFINFDKYKKIQDKIVKNAVNEITNTIGHSDKISSLRENAFNLYCDKFTSKKFLSNFEDLLFKLVPTNIDECEHSNPLPLGEPYIEDIDNSWFETCPQPLTIGNYGHGELRKVFKQYCYTPLTRLNELGNLSSFSILNFKHEQFNPNFEKSFLIFDNIKEASIGLINLEYHLDKRSKQVGSPLTEPLEQKRIFTLKSKISLALLPYPRLHRIAYRMYTIMKSKQ